MVSVLLDQRKWAAFNMIADFKRIIDPRRLFHVPNNTRKINRYINRQLDSRYNTRGGKFAGNTKSKTIIDLALNGYVSERDTSEESGNHLDATFR
jgi:hypothetical protein